MKSSSIDGRPETLVSYAERMIKTALADGSIAPGERLSPHVLGPKWGLSHIPVREALAALRTGGYVEHFQGRGFFAKQLSSEDLLDIYHWRGVLERETYQIAVPILTEDDLREMRRLVDQMSRRTAPKDRLEYLELNRVFHFVPFLRAGSERLLHVLNYLWDSALPYHSLELTDSTRSHEEHVAMLDHLAARDTERVIEDMDDHRRVRTDKVTQWEARRAAGSGG